MGVTSFLLLSCLGLAITSQAQDCTKPVGGPNMSLRDADILLEQFPDGSQVSFVCDVGYTSAGGSRTITCTAGSWTRLSLRCERKNCGAFEEVENGNIDYPDGGTEFGDKIVITCLPGFRLVGRGEILCEDAGWNGRKPRCEVVTCDPPAQVQHGSFSPVEESYNYRDVVQYSCDRDFTLNGSRSASCSDDATFQPAPPKCIRVQCEEPEIKDASWVSGSRPPYGYQATVTHKCNLGFKMIGQPTIVCNINSKWSPKPPTCEKVTCAQLSNVEHGSFGPVKESYNYKDVVQYSCEKGFTLSGSKSISCSDDGTFKPAPPTCIKVTCAPLPNVEHGSFGPVKESYNYNDVVQYSCQTGFKLSGSNSVSCSDDGTFQPPPPTCTQVTCAPLPNVEHGSFSPVKESYNYNDVVQYSCQTGFALSGSNSVSCSDDGTFKPAPPTCTPVTCAPPPKVEHGSFSPDKKSYTYTDVVQYSCEKGFALSGSNSVSCSDDGTFKPAPPTCTRTPTTPKTTTTTTTTTTTKSKEGTGGDGEKDDGNKNLGLGLGIFGGIVILIVALVLVCHHFGWGPFEKKKCTDRTHPDTEAPKVEENLPLSSQQQS